jgi:hypothetical protein
LARLLGEHGVVQFTRGRLPDLDSGFCLDDNARALIVAVAYLRRGEPDPIANQIGEAALQFMVDASREAPHYHNHMNAFGEFTDEFASPESVGRLLWALGITATCTHDDEWRRQARRLLRNLAHVTGALTSLHARAYAMLGLAALVNPEAASPVYPVHGYDLDYDVARWARETLYAMAAAMRFEFLRNARTDWLWWETELTYDNARIPEAMLRASAALSEPAFADIGLVALRFLTSVTQPSDMFTPIGAPGWYGYGGTRPMYDQQPLEAAAMVDMFIAAARVCQMDSFLNDAKVAYEWYLGNNVAGTPLVDVDIGLCHDAIVPTGLNPNMGAESTLAYLQATLFLFGECQLNESRTRRSTKRSPPSAITASIDAATLPAAIIEG